MTHVVYALRQVGTSEPRYIGCTSRSARLRLEGHLANAKQMPSPTPFAAWLMGNQVEAVEVMLCPTRDEALAAERQAIKTAAAIGHRLFNCHHVPSEQQINKRVGEKPRWRFSRKQVAARALLNSAKQDAAA